jgi:PAS domain S-box-containing protein
LTASVPEVTHPEDVPKGLEAFEHLVETGQSVSLDKRYLRPDGTIVWANSRLTRLDDEQGRPRTVLAVTVDLSDRKRAELLLVEQKRLLELIATGTPLDECLTAVCASVSQLNPGIRACFLLADAQGLRFSHFITPDLAPSFGQGLQDAPINDLCIGTCGEAVYRGQPITCTDIANDKLWSQDWRALCVAHGILACHSTPVIGTEQSPHGSLMLCFDQARMPTDWEYQLAEFGTQIASIAFERDLASLALRQNEERYGSLVTVTSSIVWIAEGNGAIVSAPAWEAFTGQTLEQYQGWGWFERVHPDDRETAAQIWMHAIENKILCEIEYRLLHRDGQYRHTHTRAVPILDAAGNVREWVGTVTDISDHKRAEAEREQLLQCEQSAREQAEQGNRIKDEFLAVLSHELRSPLNPILGWSRLLQNGKLDEAKTAQALATIERNAKLQAELIEDLLDVSRILRGKLSLNVSPVNLGAIVEGAIETMRLAAEAKSIAVEINLAPNVKPVSGDSTRLQQVVWNLLSNAVKFTPAGGRVAVQLEQVDNQAQITVRDNGKGIPSAFLPYVFDYFRQADGATTRQFGGLGLGLAIVRHLVELHGGTVEADSLGEGQGSTFIVKLPLMPIRAAEHQQEPFPQLSLNLQDVRVLVVDDDTDTREFVVFLLEQAGANFSSASSAGEALTVLRQFKPNILLSDIGMPDMDGYMLMQQVRALPSEQGGQIPAIALTAYVGEMNQQQAIAAGFQRHLAKPVEPEELIKTITSFTATHPSSIKGSG